MSSLISTFPPLFLFAPWVLLGLLLAGPFLLIVTAIVVALAVVAVPLLLAAPYLLVRRYRARHVAEKAPRVPIELRRAVA